MIMPSRRAGKLVIIIAVVAAVAGVAGGTLLGPRLLKKAPAQKAKPAAKAEKHAQKPGAHEEGEAEQLTIVPLGDFLVNVEAGAQLRYLRTEVSLGFADLPAPSGGGHGGGKGPAIPEGDIAIARDRVVTVLSAGSYSSLRSPEGRQALKQRVLAQVRKGLPQYTVTDVLFTAFVTQ